MPFWRKQMEEPVLTKDTGMSEMDRGIGYGYSSMQGWRKQHEDAHCVERDDDSGLRFFGVFDGHGGPGAARFCAQTLGTRVMARVRELVRDPDEAPAEGDTAGAGAAEAAGSEEQAGSAEGESEESAQPVSEKVSEEASEGAADVGGDASEDADAGPAPAGSDGACTGNDDSDPPATASRATPTTPTSRPTSTSPASPMEAAVQSAFADVDAEMHNGKEKYVTAADEFGDPGSTATTLLVTPTHLIFSNVGDSRAMLCRGGEIVFTTKDHKPDDEEEETRIKRAGGFVVHGRVCRVLAVSRALGDFALKEDKSLPPDKQMLTAVPDVVVIPRTPEDEFVFLGCDGIFEGFANQALCDFVIEQLSQPGKSLADVCDAVVDKSFAKGSTDNITAMLVVFPAANKFARLAAAAKPKRVTRKPMWVSALFGAWGGGSSAPEEKDKEKKADDGVSQGKADDAGVSPSAAPAAGAAEAQPEPADQAAAAPAAAAAAAATSPTPLAVASPRPESIVQVLHDLDSALVSDEEHASAGAADGAEGGAGGARSASDSPEGKPESVATPAVEVDDLDRLELVSLDALLRATEGLDITSSA